MSGLQRPPETTPPQQYLAHFGIFVVLIGAWLAFTFVRDVSPRSCSVAANDPERRIAPPAELVWRHRSSARCAAPLAASACPRLDELIAPLLPFLALVAYLALREFRLQRPDGGLRLFLLMLDRPWPGAERSASTSSR